VPDLPGLRPTAARVREAVFSSVGGLVEGARVLDLFAGCGALGLEALSRGASDCVFVEADRRTARALRDNVARLGVGEQAFVVEAEVAVAPLSGRRFDLVLLDPPWGAGLVEPTLSALTAGGLVVSGATAVAVHARASGPCEPAGWEVMARQTYGEGAATRLVAVGVHRDYRQEGP